MNENLNMEELNQDRRAAVEKTIKPIGPEELKSLGEKLFPYLDHPWRERYFSFIAENAGATFYHATTNDGIHILYCRAKDQGMWFIPDSGMGPLQEKGRTALKEILGGSQ